MHLSCAFQGPLSNLPTNFPHQKRTSSVSIKCTAFEVQGSRQQDLVAGRAALGVHGDRSSPGSWGEGTSWSVLVVFQNLLRAGSSALGSDLSSGSSVVGLSLGGKVWAEDEAIQLLLRALCALEFGSGSLSSFWWCTWLQSNCQLSKPSAEVFLPALFRLQSPQNKGARLVLLLSSFGWISARDGSS